MCHHGRARQNDEPAVDDGESVAWSGRGRVRRPGGARVDLLLAAVDQLRGMERILEVCVCSKDKS